MKTVTMMLTNGLEIIGSMKQKTTDTEYFLEFPQQIKWWRDPNKGQCYEFVPYLYGANLQMEIPVTKDHVTTMAEANEDISIAYRGVVDSLLAHMERMVGLKRSYEERGLESDFEVRQK